MCNRSNDSNQEHVHAVLSRREVLIAGAALVAAPFLGRVTSIVQAAQTTNTSVPVGGPAHAQAGKVRGTATEWLNYAGDKAGSKYSPLAQIGRDNFNRLSVAWTWRSADEEIAKANPHLKTWVWEATPLMVGGVHAERSGDLRKFIEEGKKIIVSTVQKFPFILDEIATEGGKTFAIIIDEAHSSQGGKTSAAMSQALSAPTEDDEEGGDDPEDVVNEALAKRMQERKMLTNASYFAFTATPKNKTLEMFGEPLPPDAEGNVKHRPFHSYTMKQAIDEGWRDICASLVPAQRSSETPRFWNRPYQPRRLGRNDGLFHAADCDWAAKLRCAQHWRGQIN